MSHDAAGDGQPAGTEPSAAALEGMERLMGHLNGYFAAVMLGLGHRSGLLAVLLEGGGTAAELATRAGTHPRSTEEWLAGMTAAGYARHDNGTFSLTDGQDQVFQPGRLLPFDATIFLELQDKFATILGRVADSMIDGKGVPYSAYQPEFSAGQDRLNEPMYESFLVDDFLASADGVVERLDVGAQLVDIGCGGGKALAILAERFPRSTFIGYDIDAAALDIGRNRASTGSLENLRFVAGDAAEIDLGQSVDVVIAVDAIHDQGRPQDVLAAVVRSLRPGGTFVMVEPLASGDLDTDVQHPMAPMMYATSLGHCVQVSLAAGGPGLGSMWGRAKAIPMLEAAGFTEISVHESASENLVYAART